MPMSFYDRAGKAVAYTEDDVHIFLYTGYPVGYIADSSVYTYAGRHLGTIRSGWLRDHDGKSVFFTEAAVAAGGLELPEKQAKPRKLIKKPKPARGHRERAPVRAEDGDGWSDLPSATFFF